MSENALGNLLRLTPLAEPPISFEEFLTQLNENRDCSDTAPAVVYRAIKAMGREKPEDEPDPERRAYLQMLADREIPSWLAFKHVVGSQRFAMSPVNYLRSAASNGTQLKQMLIIEGNTGCGKDYFIKGIGTALENHGKVFAVQGCPDHENPINLLKLLPKEQQQKLAEATGLGQALFDMLAVACEPCQDCYNKVMGTVDKPNEKPSLAEIKVEKIRLSTRAIGISEWKPGQACSLISALRQANRGFILMPDAFVKRSLEPGKTDERLILLDATRYRRIPGAASKCGSSVAAASPLDEVIVATTNTGALEEFLNGLPDKQAFTSRGVLLRLPYNTVRVEEVRALKEELAQYKAQCHFDPLALKLIATLAVLSRFRDDDEYRIKVDPIDRLRLYQGEQYPVKMIGKSSSSSSSPGGYGNKKPPVPKVPDIDVVVDMLWATAPEDEGMWGLDVPQIFSWLSSINGFGLRGSKHKCISSLQVIALLRILVDRKLDTSNLTDAQEDMLSCCLDWLGGNPSSDVSLEEMEKLELFIPGKEPSGIIEAEYRRLLKQQFLQIFAPDYDKRAQKLYDDYKLHAQAAFLGEKTTVRDPSMGGDVPINHRMIDDLDRYRLGKPKDYKLTADDKKFRGQLEVLISDARELFMEQRGENDTATFKETWECLSDLAAGIRRKLDEDVGQLVEKLLSTEVTADLKEAEQKQLVEAKARLQGLGYCEACGKQALEYAKHIKVWSHKG